MSKKTVSKTEYQQLIGLLVLARQHGDAIGEIVEAMRGITGEEDEWGHCGDAAYSDYSAKTLLKKLGLKVK